MDEKIGGGGKLQKVDEESKYAKENSNKNVNSDGFGGVHKPTPAEQEKLKTAGVYEQENTETEELTKLLGEEFKGYKGQKAIDKLLQEKHGHVKGAFHREDIGDIDLLWGNDYLGLQHIIKQRERQNINTVDFLSDIAEVIEKGDYLKKNEKGNFEFLSKGKMAIIAPEYHGNRIIYLLTAYKTRYKK